MLTYTLSSMISCNTDNILMYICVYIYIYIYHHTLTTYQYIQLPVSSPSNWKQPRFRKDHICSWFHSIQSVHLLPISSILHLYVIFFVSITWNEVYIHQSLLIYYFKHLYNAICKDNTWQYDSIFNHYFEY